MPGIPSGVSRYVTKASWEKLREPFRRVWSREARLYILQDLGVKIYRVGNIVRIDIKDDYD